MNDKYSQILSQTFADIMENLAFMFVDSEEKDKIENSSENNLRASISFSGYIDGYLEIVASTKLCRTLAANMLGIEVEDKETEKQAGDALKEALNTICGRLLTEIAGEDPIFNLSTPKTDTINLEAWNKIKANKNTLCFRIDEQPAMLMLDVKG